MPPVNSAEAIKSRYATATRDGQVTLAEVEDLMTLAKDGGGVTNSERRQVRELFIIHGDRFEADARARMNAFINDEIPALLIDESVVVDGGDRRDLADPEVCKEDAGKLSFEWVDARLFVDGVDDDDVMQGYIGDCYMMAGFAAVAAHHPDVIEDAIRDNGDGTFTVRFYETSYYGEPRPVEITVDGQMPTHRGGMYYGKNRDSGELWVGLMEKAYAQWKGGYDAIGQGGSAGEVMAALTGRNDDYQWLSTRSSHDAIYRQIDEAVRAGRSVAAGTHGTAQEEMYKGTGVYAHHAYSITGVSEENGTRYVHLRNPWGEVEPTGNGADDGHFKLEMETFLKLYSSLYLS